MNTLPTVIERRQGSFTSLDRRPQNVVEQARGTASAAGWIQAGSADRIAGIDGPTRRWCKLIENR
ncbi:hypothetical protein [Nocardia sp. XZ_19_385]|uniref:hypothetical protein n=1 Tax=Nocardia sp. XZ_19_385 TaxID=2769488 RepID=UPI00188F3391|nr:hypothetical protein [Nocardia sp. XZ_19_385]